MCHINRFLHTAYVATGANLGRREWTIRRALDRLDSHPAIDVEATSDLVETAPVGGPPQPNYLNGVAKLTTDLPPEALLQVLQSVENTFGRRRTVRWGPRTLDLDLLLYDDMTVQTPQLTLPHPRMHERRFVLEPLVQVGPDALHPPTGLTARELLRRLDDDSQTP